MNSKEDDLDRRFNKFLKIILQIFWISIRELLNTVLFNLPITLDFEILKNSCN